MDKKNLAFNKTNFIFLTLFFSPMRIKVAPVVCFIGFVSIIFAIIHKPKDTDRQ